MIYIANKKRKEEGIKKQYPNAIILDVTSKAGWAQQLSPFLPLTFQLFRLNWE